MKIREIYELAIAKGMENDPRGLEAVQKYLAREKEKYEKMKEEEKEEYDLERLVNPYDDTRILVGDPEREVRRVLVGIDMEVGEVLLADRLGEKGRPVDLILSHHPEGKAMASLHQVMHLQEDILARFGVPINVAEGIMSSRIAEVKRAIMPLNHNRAVDAARILGLAFMCVHTAADNMVTAFLQKLMDEKQPETLGDILKLLKEQPEYREAVKYKAGPAIVVGSRERRAGKIMVDMTGGTSGSEDAYARLSQAGVGTLLVMHMGEKHRKEAEKNHINVIIAGHMASDSLGMNLFLDELEARGVEIIPCAGLLRFSRRS
ncbi:Putative GTP cyclohydrolase 1 type 2, NIF3 family [Desulfofundulus australicus DSM 11792]|uniref:Putative GTP cyclohydrolase 1 type 2, NIF3 family n=1 Tax=Desulfofundulus australicus DSM 11792 TaxID=1121425 RepID=A0A1M5BYD0_9FIRM|nr:NGG1p interacting factor NIF3 [Desulfofundulus australicus]SHF47416.1 Putative GTP cyclohydrolase 1 type 2, NIF3 family [Desulfofundulus australicus DSM 11792]